MSGICSSGEYPVEPPRSSWSSLPPELRLMILEEAAHRKAPNWSLSASVCKEWRDFIEVENYKKLNLEVSCLDDLNDMVPRHKRHLVNHIYFEIELPKGPHACCLVGSSHQGKTSTIVSKAMQKLFTALGTWEQRPHGQLTLELNVTSPSDSQHWFKPLYFSDDRVEGDWLAVHPRHDPRHGWVDGKLVSPVPEAAVRRAFRPIKLDTGLERWPLPCVPGVTSFVIRRQLRRCISTSGLSAILEALPMLKHMSYEPWAMDDGASVKRRQAHVKNLRQAILQQLSKAVTSLVVFEDSRKFYKVLQSQASEASTSNTINMLSIRDGLGDIFAKKSCSLERLAVSFMVDAKDIFRHCKPAWTWSQLKSVTLTSQLLRDNLDAHRRIEDLLCRATALVKRMPKIDTFVLWNGGKDNACAFIYRVNRGDVSITWRGTWRLEMSREVVEAWQSAASTRSDRELEIHQEGIDSAVNCVGDAIQRLRLPCQVAEPASLWQMRREGNLVP
ncbi:hypothetical protein V8C35DRAFT_326894 [Trichoderma chlorosporum]